MEAPLEDVEAGPARHVGALFEQRDQFSCSDETRRRTRKMKKSSVHHLVPDLYTLSLLAGECSLHHAVVLSQHPAPVYQLGIHGPEGREGMGSQGVFLLWLWCPLGMVDVEDHISFGHVKVPGDDGGGLSDVDQHLQEDVRKHRTADSRPLIVSLLLQACNVHFIQLVAP